MGWQYTTEVRMLFLMQLGVVDSGLKNLEEGLVFGYYDSGPWFGYKLKDKEYDWIGHVPIGTELGVWTHTCFTYSLTSGSYKLVENGEIIFEKNIPKLLNVGKSLGSTFNIISVGCVHRTDLYKYSTMQGRITDVQVWDTELSPETMKAITSCESTDMYSGTLFNWQETPWKFDTPRQLSELEIVDRKHVCLISKKKFLFLPFRSSFWSALEINCAKFSGALAGYNTKSEFKEITDFLFRAKYFRNDLCMFRMTEEYRQFIGWLRLGDYRNEGVFIDEISKTVPTYLPWEENRPVVGSTIYNCVTFSVKASPNLSAQLNVSQLYIRDEECHLPRCILCELPNTVKWIRVRGLCKNSMYDTDYYYTVSDEGDMLYVGQKTSSIWYDSKKEQWIWVDRKDKTAVATSNSRLDSLFLGANSVNFENTSEPCIKDRPTKVIKIKMTTCLENDLFTCDNGLCIPMDKRCDQTPNCEDESDELNCKMLEISNNYNRRIPPFTFDSKKNKIDPVQVNVTMTILKILKITEVDHLFTMKFVMIMEWYDHRLKYYNLKSKKSANALTTEEAQTIWIPKLVFSNTQENDVTAGTKNTVLTVTKEGNHTRSEPDTAEEINIFEGKENRLTFQTTYAKVFECEYQLSRYPFDMQTCRIDLTADEFDKQSLRIIPMNVFMKGKIKLTQYIVVSWKLAYINGTNPTDGIQMVFKLKRRMINVMLTSYLPTTIILFIVYCTNYFRLSHFNTALTINLTSMLVLTTLFIGVSNSLPRVAYIKVKKSIFM